MRKKMYGILSCFVIGTVLFAGGCQASGENLGTLTVGVRDDIMNFGYLNELTGKYYGMEIDIANEMASRLGYEDVEFVTVTPDDRKEQLLEGKVDCLIAAYSIVDTRKENFDFSAPYYTDDTVIMAERSTLYSDISDLQNKTIGILSGANAGPLLANRLYELGMITDKVVSNTDEGTQYEGASVIKTSSYDELSVLLEEGVVDAACMDGCIANTYMNEDRFILDRSISKQEYGVATVKGSELSQPVADAIQEMLDDGTIAQCIDKWN